MDRIGVNSLPPYENRRVVIHAVSLTQGTNLKKESKLLSKGRRTAKILVGSKYLTSIRPLWNREVSKGHKSWKRFLANSGRLPAEYLQGTEEKCTHGSWAKLSF